MSEQVLTTELFALIQDDLVGVEAKMREAAVEHHPALADAVQSLLASGGKRVRPAVILLSAHMLEAEMDRAIAVAAAIEMLHTATLVHDDLIDGSLLRRGAPTLNAKWTPAATVLTGDYLFARAAQFAAQADSVPLMTVFARTLMTIVNGEINQLFKGRGEISREGYTQRIYAKTASLFEVAAESAAILAEVEAPAIQAMRTYGREIGMAFQIVDDILDFTGDAAQLGKPVGSDLRQGLFTLPVLYFHESHPGNKDLNALFNGRAGDPETVDRVVAAVRASGAIQNARDEARRYLARAQATLNSMPDNAYRRALSDLAEYLVNRNI